MNQGTTPLGGRLQAGIPRSGGNNRIPYLVRGVVVATYVPDDSNYPFSDIGITDTYCDVMVYTNMSGGRFYILPSVLVTPDVAGLQRGKIYRPRAAKAYINGLPFAASIDPDPSQLDGDHVLVGFIDGERNCPVIVRFMPHPSKDAGNSRMLPAGQRQALRVADGDPDFAKHHGAYFGVSDGGDFVVDTTLANDGTILPGGAEPPAGSTGSGNSLARVGSAASHQRSVMNAASPAAQVELLRETLAGGGYTLDAKAADVLWQVMNTLGNAMTLKHSGASTTLTVGDGAKSVAVAEQIQTWWNGTIVPYIQAMIFQTQLGPTAPGPTVAPPSFDASIISGKVKIPEN